VPYPVPQALTKDGIKEVVEQYVRAARNAMEAGFDGVEIHSANGYLLEQFIKSGSNKRTDDYGGSIEARCRFPLEVVDAVVAEVGADKVGIRMSPFSIFNNAIDDTPYTTYMYMVEQLNHRKLAYIHMVEPSITGDNDHADEGTYTLQPFRQVWRNAFLVAGGYTAETGANALTKGHADVVVYGRLFLANPDLPKRFQLGAPLNEPNRETFYTPGLEGYLDYPFLK